MKRVVLNVMLLVLLASCGADGYKIKGKFSGVPDGTKVYMSLVDGELTEVDSTVVNNGWFEFSGKQDVPSMRMIYSYASINGGPVVLENGVINVLIKDKFYRTGTPLNEELQRYISCEEDVLQQSTVIGVLERMAGVNPLRLDSLKSVAEISRTKFVKTVYEIIDNNVDNALGVFVMTKSGDILPPQVLDALMSSVPGYLRNERYEELYSQVKIELDNIKRAELTAVGKYYFDFELPDIFGKKVIFSDIVKKSKFTLLNFWASWCPSCRMEIPKIKRLFNTYAQNGFATVSVSLDDDAELWHDAIDALKMNWVQLCDPSRGSTELAFAYGVKSVPTLLLIDRDGKIIMRSNTIDDMMAKIELLMK